MYSAAVMRLCRTGTRIGDDPIDEFGRRTGDGQRVPAQLVRGSRHFVEIVVDAIAADTLEGPVHDPRTYAVQPGAAVDGARRGKGGAGDLFGIQAVRTALW